MEGQPATGPDRLDTAGLGAIVLAGGRSARFGADKTRAHLSGSTLLDRALATVPPGVPVVVVGPRRATPRRLVTWTTEAERFAGPAVALAAGVAALPDGVRSVLVLAADQPFAADVVTALLTRRQELRAQSVIAGADHARDGRVPVEGWVPVDGTGRRHPLPSLLEVGPLRGALENALPTGTPTTSTPTTGTRNSGTRSPRTRSLRAVLERLTLAEVPVPEEALTDIDRPEDLAAARAREHRDPRG